MRVWPNIVRQFDARQDAVVAQMNAFDSLKRFTIRGGASSHSGVMLGRFHSFRISRIHVGSRFWHHNGWYGGTHRSLGVAYPIRIPVLFAGDCNGGTVVPLLQKGYLYNARAPRGQGQDSFECNLVDANGFLAVYIGRCCKRQFDITCAGKNNFPLHSVVRQIGKCLDTHRLLPRVQSWLQGLFRTYSEKWMCAQDDSICRWEVWKVDPKSLPLPRISWQIDDSSTIGEDLIPSNRNTMHVQRAER